MVGERVRTETFWRLFSIIKLTGLGNTFDRESEEKSKSRITPEFCIIQKDWWEYHEIRNPERRLGEYMARF